MAAMEATRKSPFVFFQSKEEAEALFDRLKKAAAFNVRVYLVHENRADLNNLQHDMDLLLHAMSKDKSVTIRRTKTSLDVYRGMDLTNRLYFMVPNVNRLRGIDKEQILEV